MGEAQTRYQKGGRMAALLLDIAHVVLALAGIALALLLHYRR